ncbi:MAG: glycosyltransferase [Bacteroidota bacterium]
MSTTGPQKIIIIGSAHPLRGGGIATFNERLAKEFIDLGHATDIYSFSLQYPSFLFPGSSQFTTDPPPPGLIIHSKINSVNPLNWLKVGNEIKNRKPDLVIVRYWLPFMGACLGTILRRIRLNKHTRIVCIADNIIPHEARPGDNLLTKYFVKPVDAFITMSDKVKDDLHLFAPAQPNLLVPHPLYDNFGEAVSQTEARNFLGINLSDRVLLYFGFIRKYKGLDLLFDALKILRADPATADIKLLVAGEFYDNRKIYDEQIAANGILENLVLRTEFIPDNEVKYYLCAADAVVQPYRNATQSGVTPLAYHFEKPMIVTNVGGLPALVPNNKVGLVAEPTAESIAEKIAAFFKKGADAFVPGIIEEKKKYSWSVMVEAVLKLAAAPRA